VVSHCLPLGAFIETPSLTSVSSTIRPSSSLLEGCGVRLYQRSLSRLPLPLLPQGYRVYCIGGVVGIWGRETSSLSECFWLDDGGRIQTGN